MAQKSKAIYVCSACAYESTKWYGRCPGCGEWNTMEEETRMAAPSGGKSSASIKSANSVHAIKIREISADMEHRYDTGYQELNRVLGGGLVKGSLVLLTGDPGIGKSTLLLQICEQLGEQLPILYVSGEESPHQIKLRADRLHVSTDGLSVMGETDAQSVSEYICTELPGLVIIDSIQTMSISDITSSPGSITQVRECTNLFMRTAKALDIPIIIVGHVNKDGNIAGPKVLEHIVDTVLRFEGERNLSYRILRAVKNRFGSTNEIGVFEMLDHGLGEVENPSMMLLSGRMQNASGTCVTCVMEGTRPVLAEVQGLVATTGFGNPRRVPTGFDYNRMAMILAVLEKRSGYYFNNMDAYINIVGGLRLDEPGTDLPVALALVSSLKDVPLQSDIVAFGEIGLAGEIRAVSNCEQRINEAARLGFTKVLVPMHSFRVLSAAVKEKADIVGVRNVRAAFEAVMG